MGDRHTGSLRRSRCTRGQLGHDAADGLAQRHRQSSSREDPQVSGDRSAPARERVGRYMHCQSERGRRYVRARHRPDRHDDDQCDAVQDPAGDESEEMVPRVRPGDRHPQQRTRSVRGGAGHRYRGRRRGRCRLGRASHRHHCRGAGARIGSAGRPVTWTPAARDAVLRRRLAACEGIRGPQDADPRTARSQPPKRTT